LQIARFMEDAESDLADLGRDGMCRAAICAGEFMANLGEGVTPLDIRIDTDEGMQIISGVRLYLSDNVKFISFSSRARGHQQGREL